MESLSVIKQHQKKLETLCKEFKVEQFYAFGSVARGDFDAETSDIDLIVHLQKMPPIEKGQTLLSLWNQLELLFGRKVDLLSEKPISNPFLKEQIEASKLLIYDRQSLKILV
ncbi:MAG: nucleotidyltransferase domain-containing protein [Bacteroidota bacterium]